MLSSILSGLYPHLTWHCSNDQEGLGHVDSGPIDTLQEEA